MLKKLLLPSSPCKLLLLSSALLLSACAPKTEEKTKPPEPAEKQESPEISDAELEQSVQLDTLTEPEELVETVVETPTPEFKPTIDGKTKPTPLTDNPAQHWVATDSLGRALPTADDVRESQPDKYVGIFYYIWVGNHTRKVFDISKIIQEPKSKRKWGPKNNFHFWGEPEYGYYHASDPWVIRHDMQMLTNAGIDFIHFDNTNALLYLNTVKAVCQVIREMRAEGIKAPSVTFTTNSKSGQTMNKAYDEFYSQNLYSDVWFYWQGKPLMLGDANDPALRPEVKEFFTIKRSWVAPRHPAKDRWDWLAFHPQSYGFSESQDKPEHVSVAAAFHPNNPRGKSYHNGKQPPVDENYLTPLTAHGPHLEEQFLQARKIDPQVITITQWNEWLAQRFIMDERRRKKNGKYAGRPIKIGDTWFVDVWNSEFNRDIVPMKGGYTDSHYYQMIKHIRHFKGMGKPQPRPEMRTMEMDGKFEEWNTITRKHWDPSGDTQHRDFEGTDPKTRFKNTTGRNDIIETKAAHDRTSVYFMVKTKEALTKHTDPGWMLLFVDCDQDPKTGWLGYDIVVNRNGVSKESSNVEIWSGKSWQYLGKAELAYSGTQLELKVPVIYFKPSKGGFDFKWADNPQHLNDASAFFLDGDAAPDRRFNYRY